MDCLAPERLMCYHQTAMCWACGECRAYSKRLDHKRCPNCGYAWDQACEKIWKRVEFRIIQGVPKVMKRVELKGGDGADIDALELEIMRVDAAILEKKTGVRGCIQL